MAGEYHKINSVYKREEQKPRKLIEGQWSLPEFEYLADNRWDWTEKVDGTNVRVIWDAARYPALQFAGKTDNAQLHPTLLMSLHVLFNSEMMGGAFPAVDGVSPAVTLYGEGYGPKIQKGGGLYRDDPSFVLFDVLIGGWWLKREDVLDIGGRLRVDVVPEVGHGTLYEAIEYTRNGFKSRWGDFAAEGLVCRPHIELKARNGARVITKIKTRDFA